MSEESHTFHLQKHWLHESMWKEFLIPSSSCFSKSRVTCNLKEKRLVQSNPINQCYNLIIINDSDKKNIDFMKFVD